MPDTLTTSATLLDALEHSLDEAATYNERSRVAPAAILWTDAKEEWTALLPYLRDGFPHLLTLGDYDPATRTGPAIWIKCMIGRTLDTADWDDDTVPIVYLPGTSRRDIRAVENCADALKPLAELQYRGTLWSQTNGRDWTVRAFLVSENGGLGFDVAGDQATQEALHRALPALATAELDVLRGRSLDADDFRMIVTQDPVRDLLRWIDAPDAMEDAWDGSRWETFCDICRETYGFDPEHEGRVLAARKLGKRNGPWARVWERYQEAPSQYNTLPQVLRMARPPKTGDLFACEPTWPQDNAAAEDALREALVGLSDLRPDEALEEIKDLEATHGKRRSWVWSTLGDAPLAAALEPLSTVADAVQPPVGGSTPEDVAASYRDSGWRADAAVLCAWASVQRAENIAAVHAAVAALYRPWLERGAEALQKAVAVHGLPDAAPSLDWEPGTVVLFADALRFDVGQRLAEQLQAAALEVDTDWHWAAMPTVTATAKPALFPLASDLDPESSISSQRAFTPHLREEGSVLDTRRFRNRLMERGHQFLEAGDVGDPTGTAWTECGTLDKHGHAEEWKMARRIGEVVQELKDRIRQLLAAGWSTVRVVTDHGWLVLPDALPKEPLPHDLVSTRWGRCAVLKEGNQVDRLTVGWHWNPTVRIALAPGIHVHRKGIGYAHGGLSVQECVVPRLTVRSGDNDHPAPHIESVDWQRLRCRVRVEHPTAGLRIDVRTQANNASTSIAMSAKPVKDNGTASVVVPDPSDLGCAATVVLLSESNTVLHTDPTEVGRDA